MGRQLYSVSLSDVSVPGTSPCLSLTSVSCTFLTLLTLLLQIFFNSHSCTLQTLLEYCSRFHIGLLYKITAILCYFMNSSLDNNKVSPVQSQLLVSPCPSCSAHGKEGESVRCFKIRVFTNLIFLKVIPLSHLMVNYFLLHGLFVFININYK